VNVKTVGLLTLASVLGAFAWSRRSSAPGFGLLPSDARPGERVQLRQGAPYLFIVRTIAPDDAVRAALATKAVEGLEFAEATVPPFWSKPGEHYSNRAAAFRKTLDGNAVVELGQAFYGIGQLEKVARLDGQPIEPLPPLSAPAASPPVVTASEEVDYFPWV